MLYQLSYCPLRVTQGSGRGATIAFPGHAGRGWLLLGWRLQRVISTPVLLLTEVTRVVTRDHRYDLRVTANGFARPHRCR